ncbi:MAG: class I SAM-dependent methyltransferase [Crocinitomicaceae bacterium]|nr:class I SAM-dependent methyltransferase [Crocinitomicaceae bacterium]MBK8927928.1 class I SAM-dependent methyltransferase [Crocinitomicaceae bacterium]
MRGKLKGWFFLLRLHVLVPSKIFIFLGHLAQLSRFVHQNKKKGHSDFYSAKFVYAKREDLFRHVIQTEKIESVDYLEFGVSKGHSFRWWANEIKSTDARFYGFDTFTGLPENWGPFKAGDMSNGNEPPKMDDGRCQFYQGLFQQTLLPFLATYKNENRKVIHMDADLYSATLYVLTLITPYLKKGDIIFFDEFNVPMHEYKAFTEWANSFYIKYEVVGSVNNFYQTAVKIL